MTYFVSEDIAYYTGDATLADGKSHYDYFLCSSDDRKFLNSCTLNECGYKLFHFVNFVQNSISLGITHTLNSCSALQVHLKE